MSNRQARAERRRDERRLAPAPPRRPDGCRCAGTVHAHFVDQQLTTLERRHDYACGLATQTLDPITWEQR